MDPPPARVPFGNSPLNGRMLVIAVAVLASVILLILGMHLYAKWMWRGVSARQSSLRRRHRQTFLQADASQATTATRGLERAVVEALGTFKYLSAEATDGVLECAVCLSEFEDSEEGRLLPKCKHSFHVDCIDMWLHSNTTCPLCRASVQPDGEGNDAEVPATIVSGSNRSGSVVTHLNQLVANLEDQQLENGVRIVQFPNNVLFWGNQLQLNAQTNSAASRPPVVTDTSASSTAPSHVAIDIPTSQLTIDIPPRPVPAALFLVGPEEASTASPGTTKSQHSGPLSTPSGRLRSLRRLLSRERRPANSNSVEQGPGEIDIEPEGSVHLQRQESQ